MIVPGTAGLIVASLLILFTVYQYQRNVTGVIEVCDLTFTGNIQLHNLIVARTKKQQAEGLSHTNNAGPGMLFCFDPPDRLAFWMRNTKIPLSLGFISADGVLFPY